VRLHFPWGLDLLHDPPTVLATALFCSARCLALCPISSIANVVSSSTLVLCCGYQCTLGIP
jgi:hypothetical protein